MRGGFPAGPGRKLRGGAGLLKAAGGSGHGMPCPYGKFRAQALPQEARNFQLPARFDELSQAHRFGFGNFDGRAHARLPLRSVSIGGSP